MSAVSRRLLASASLALLALLCIAYANHFDNSFHFDDAHAVVGNAALRDLANVPRFFVDATTFSTLPTNQMYRPLLLVSYALDVARAGGLQVRAFHATTFAFFAAQCVLMALLFARLLAAERPHAATPLLALFGTALYALHPVQAETINYVSARSDSLSTFFVVASVLAWAAWPSGRRWGVPIVLALAGVLVKQTAAVTPLLVLLLELLVARRPWREALKATLPFFAAMGATVLFMATRTPAGFTPGGASRLRYAITQPYAVWHYVTQLFAPTKLSADTDLAPFASPLEPRALLGFLFVAFLAGSILVLARRRETGAAAFGLSWFLVALAPTSSVVPLAEVMNDHRMFFPFVGLALAAASLAAHLVRRHEESLRAPAARAAVFAGALLLLLACAAGTRARNEVWRDDESLWRDAVAKNPRNGRARMNLGLALMQRGALDEALAQYARALDLAPGYSYLHTNIGIALAAKGRFAEAEESFRRGVSLAQGSAEPAYWFARFLAQQGRTSEAAAQAADAVTISPRHPDARALLEQIEREPRTPEEWLERSLGAYRAGDFEKSLAAARRALALRPGYAEALNNVCAAHNAAERWDEAIAACEEALRRRPDFPLAKSNLAWAHAGKKRKGTPP